ncbi:MAG: hypothetical protein AAGF11_35745 [Myxococcota bacterium]
MVVLIACPSSLVINQAFACGLEPEQNEEAIAKQSAATGTWLLRVEVEPGLADADLYPGWVHNRNPTIAERLSESLGHEQWIAIELEGETYDYQVRVIPMWDGEPAGAVGDKISCECTNAELMELIDENIGVAVERLQASAAEAILRDASVEAELNSEERLSTKDTEGAKDTKDTKNRPGRLGPLGHTGIGLIVLGAGSIAAGIPLALKGPEPIVLGAALGARSTRPPGVAAAIVGGAVLATGTALFVANIVRRKRRAVSATPELDARFAGFLLRGDL